MDKENTVGWFGEDADELAAWFADTEGYHLEERAVHQFQAVKEWAQDRKNIRVH